MIRFDPDSNFEGPYFLLIGNADLKILPSHLQSNVKFHSKSGSLKLGDIVALRELFAVIVFLQLRL